MFKKTVSIFLVLGMLLCVSACNNEKAPSKPTESQVSTEQSSVEAQSQSSVEETTDNTETSKVTSTTQPTNSQTINNKPTSNSQAKPSHTHSYSNATCTSPKKCSCGATAGTSLGHNYSSATCTSPKICSRCGVTSGSALGHSYSNATCTSLKTCSRCGSTNGGALGHNYVNNKCSRCGKVDPESLPVGLETLYLIDSKYYKYKTGSFKDSFGNVYNGVHYYHDLYNSGNGVSREPRSIHNLNGKFSKFTGSIVATEKTNPDWSYFIHIYVDGNLKYSKTSFTKTTSKVNFNVDVKGASTITIKCGNEGNMGDYDMELGIVNAQLSK